MWAIYRIQKYIKKPLCVICQRKLSQKGRRSVPVETSTHGCVLALSLISRHVRCLCHLGNLFLLVISGFLHPFNTFTWFRSLLCAGVTNCFNTTSQRNPKVCKLYSWFQCTPKIPNPPYQIRNPSDGESVWHRYQNLT